MVLLSRKRISVAPATFRWSVWRLRCIDPRDEVQHCDARQTVEALPNTDLK